MLPPPMKLLPFHWPDWRVHGARPASEATWRRKLIAILNTMLARDETWSPPSRTAA